jgi:hypothetical protein
MLEPIVGLHRTPLLVAFMDTAKPARIQDEFSRRGLPAIAALQALQAGAETLGGSIIHGLPCQPTAPAVGNAGERIIPPWKKRPFRPDVKMVVSDDYRTISGRFPDD